MWKSAPEISEQIKGIENVDRLTSTHALREFWQNAIYAEAYRADEAWSKLLILSTYGKQILGEHEGLLSRIPEPDLLLALFCMFNHHDLIVDWTQTNIEGIVTLLERELLAEKLRLPYRYGRSLYDRFNDVHYSSRTDHLLPSDTRQLLEGTAVGVYQLNRYVSGPLGILESQEPRWIPPTLNLPLWHCSDTGCTAIHSVSLMPPDIPAVQASRMLKEKMTVKDGPASEWDFVLMRLHRGEGWTNGKRYYDLPVLIADCFLSQERTKLLTAALDGPYTDILRRVLSRSPRKKSDASGTAAEIAGRLLPETQLQILTLLSTDALIVLLI